MARHIIVIPYDDILRWIDTLDRLRESFGENELDAIDLEAMAGVLQHVVQQCDDGENESVIALVG